MDDVHKKALDECRPRIVIDLVFDNEFTDYLVQKDIFTSLTLEEIEAKPSRPQKVRKFLDDLQRRGPNAYMKFLECLDMSDHKDLTKIIKEAEYKIRNANTHPPTESSSHGDKHLHPSSPAEPLSQHNLSNLSDNSQALPDISSFGKIVTSPSDESASNHGNTSLSEQDNNTTDDVGMENDTDESNMLSQGSATSLQDTERTSTPEKAKYYKMTSTPRGIVLIINNENFTNGEKRFGAQQDGEMLTKLFTGLGFEVDMKKDQTGSEIEEVLLRFSQSETLHKVDSLIVVLMSHGNTECISGVDRDTRNILRLGSFFNGDGCPAMKHKPKMFIVNACRGNKDDCSVMMESQTIYYDTQLPANSDFVIAYSTFPGYVSLRSKKGSWFIQHLVEVFRDRATHDHVVDMLIEVNNRVASMERKENQGHNQTPAPIVTLRYKWYLTPISSAATTTLQYK